jgi:hypothetical protein
MHAGNIANQKSAAARVYKILLEDHGCWFSGWDLTVQARVTAVGTRVSEVRHQLPVGQRIEHRETFGEQRGSWYRLVVDDPTSVSMDFPPGAGAKNHPCTLPPVCRYGQNG